MKIFDGEPFEPAKKPLSHHAFPCGVAFFYKDSQLQGATKIPTKIY